MPAAPTLSVIVVCKNPGERLRTALASVWEQSGFVPELIVIDGGSTDGTREWLEAQRSRIRILVSESDGGVYDAMNKGVHVAKSDWVMFLGADDRFATNLVLQEVAPWLDRNAIGVVVGEAAYTDGRIYRPQSQVNPIARNFVHHQAAVYPRRFFVEHGGFDSSLRIMADYELNLRLWTHHIPFKPISLRIAVCGIGGLSDRGAWRGYREEIAVRHRYFSTARCVPWNILSVVRYLRKAIVRSFARH